MDWSAEALYNKAKVFANRAHAEQVDSALFGFWMSLSLELLARAALAHIHPVLLADPNNEPHSIQYAFGINPKSIPRSIPSKTLFARCSVFVKGFTDEMSGLCLLIADRRNAELHSGAAAFEGIENSKWLPHTYEVFEVLLSHLNRDFQDFLGDDADSAIAVLRNRHDSIREQVQTRLAAARSAFNKLSQELRDERAQKAATAVAAWIKTKPLRKACNCPACGLTAGISGETVGRGPARIDEDMGSIVREIRVLPNTLHCPSCGLELNGYRELNEAGMGAIYSNREEESPIEFFGIIPEEHVDIDALLADLQDSYYNE